MQYTVLSPNVVPTIDIDNDYYGYVANEDGDYEERYVSVKTGRLTLSPTLTARVHEDLAADYVRAQSETMMDRNNDVYDPEAELLYSDSFYTSEVAITARGTASMFPIIVGVNFGFVGEASYENTAAQCNKCKGVCTLASYDSIPYSPRYRMESFILDQMLHTYAHRSDSNNVSSAQYVARKKAEDTKALWESKNGKAPRYGYEFI